MAYDFLTMQTEVYARGFDYLNDGGAGVTRVKRWLNDAMHQIDDMEKWDYTYASAAGVPPLTAADLSVVEAVVLAAGSVPLAQQSRGVLQSVYGDLALVGTPACWYRSTPTQVSVYPTTAGSITVRYWKFGTDMVATTDVPLMPDRFRPVIVEMACAKAWRDTNAPEAEGICLQEAQRILETMRDALVPAGLRKPFAAAAAK